MNLFTVFQRAAQNLSLTPSERALLKLIKGILAAGAVAALGVLMPLIASGHVVWSPSITQAVIGAAASAMFLAVDKLFTAKADAPIPQHQQAAPTAPVAAPDPSASAI